MTTYRKRPTEVEAIQFTGKNHDEIKNFVGSHTIIDTPAFRYGPVDGAPAELWVAANNSWLPIEAGEWVIQDSLGFYPCKEDKFAETYDEVDERVRMGYPVRMLGDGGAEEVLMGICRIFGNGEMSIELSQEDADTLVETVKKNILTEMAINYRAPDEAEYVTVDLTFEKELESLLNRYSLDTYSGTPDFILASFLGNVLTDWNHAIGARAKWRGESSELPALQGTHARVKLREVLHRNGYLPNDIQHVIDDIHDAGIVLREGAS